jgi:hypothetical protein
MPISKDDRDAYEQGKSDREYTLNNPIAAMIGGVGNRPEDQSKGEAYDKGLRAEQLDDDDED